MLDTELRNQSSRWHALRELLTLTKKTIIILSPSGQIISASQDFFANLDKEHKEKWETCFGQASSSKKSQSFRCFTIDGRQISLEIFPIFCGKSVKEFLVFVKTC